MIDFLKELIEKNEDVKKALQNCNDDFLLKNEPIILAALDDENIKDGYKIKISVVNDFIEWEYVPINSSTIESDLLSDVSSKYKYKLPLDWSQYYLINLNDLTWTEDKRGMAVVFKSMINNLENNKKFKGIWLWGYNNSGKTYSSIALLNMVASKGKTVSFVSIPELITNAQNSIGDFNATISNDIEMIKKSDVVVIDDLGSERPTPWFKENILLPIIDYRLKSNKTTIFTSNLNIEKYFNKLKARSQNPEAEIETNEKIISRIRSLISSEIKIG